MKPPEILSLLEEAAGTRMYEKKKEQAINTLEKKQAKLEQIDQVHRNRSQCMGHTLCSRLEGPSKESRRALPIPRSQGFEGQSACMQGGHEECCKLMQRETEEGRQGFTPVLHKNIIPTSMMAAFA